MTARPEVFDTVPTLSQDERAAVAHRLLASLDEPADDPAVGAVDAQVFDPAASREMPAKAGGL